MATLNSKSMTRPNLNSLLRTSLRQASNALRGKSLWKPVSWTWTVSQMIIWISLQPSWQVREPSLKSHWLVRDPPGPVSAQIKSSCRKVLNSIFATHLRKTTSWLGSLRDWQLSRSLLCGRTPPSLTCTTPTTAQQTQHQPTRPRHALPRKKKTPKFSWRGICSATQPPSSSILSRKWSVRVKPHSTQEVRIRSHVCPQKAFSNKICSWK